jgi:hypothetical protein
MNQTEEQQQAPGDDDAMCAICMEPMWVLAGSGDTAAIMHTSPLFICNTCHKNVHWSCMDEAVCTAWKAQCPMCRTKFSHPALPEEEDVNVNVLHFILRHAREMIRMADGYDADDEDVDDDYDDDMQDDFGAGRVPPPPPPR